MDHIKFNVNDICCSVGGEITSEVTLLEYIRDTLELKGTKYMCREGGCGACIVNVTLPGQQSMAVNSCMVSVTSCKDWEIKTIEKLGNKLDGYHNIQKDLAANNGTQCGYCTPGWIMAMYSLLESNKNLTMKEIESSFGSNICRCTGYRPILETFKKYATDAPKIGDIEDLNFCKKSKEKFKERINDWCIIHKEDVFESKIIKIVLKDGKTWYKIFKLEDIYEIWTRNGPPYMLVAGNTAKGAYPIEEYPPILIDITGVDSLKYTNIDQNLIVGASNTLREFLIILKTTAKEEYFGYLQTLYDHVMLIAHVAIRNIATIAGNLMIKHEHNDFPSDIFLFFETVGAELTIMNKTRERVTVTMQQFLKFDMTKKIILNVLLPPLNDEYKIITYKIMPRAQNAHAIVNAGFLYRYKDDHYVLDSRIVFGGLSPTFVRATNTEAFLKGKRLFLNETLKEALNILHNELIVQENHPEPSAAYRKKLAIGLFYKGLISKCPLSVLNTRYISGGTNIKVQRPVSKSMHVYDTNTSLYPLNEPIQKLEALSQCAGEITYIDDMPVTLYVVFAAFVLSTIPKGDIVSIDPNKALDLPGVLVFYSANDIPGLNTFNSGEKQINFINNEELFCSGKVQYYNQVVGVIVANTNHIAQKASNLVNIEYKNVTKPILDSIEAIKDPNRVTLYKAESGKPKGTDVYKIIKGETSGYSQYHFPMETLACITKPTQDGLEVHSTTQWTDATQNVMARALNIDQSRIDVFVNHLGGSYGIKISRSTQVAVACGLVTIKLNRPCRFMVPLTTITKAMGKRVGFTSNYEVAVNKKGVIQYIDHFNYENYGYMLSEQINSLSISSFNNCYNKLNWNYHSYSITTDKAKNTWCRAPGTLGAVAVAEWIMEQISYEQSLDPLELRIANLSNEYVDIKDMIEFIKNNSDYDKRHVAVNKYNLRNRWKKRGLRFSLMRWTPSGPRLFEVNMSVYHGDGSVAIAHGGVEMGQGINTKAAQICAYMLKIPLDKIKVKGNSTIIAPNCDVTGASLTSQNICVGVRKCCEELLKRLEPVKKQMKDPSWKALIAKAFESDVDLQTHGFTNYKDVYTYNIYGVALTEVEIDILTGESEILRTDMMQDVGLSVNPLIDMGQVEGAFMMGLGYWTSENLVYDSNSGELLTDRTWNYYVPQAKDIPQDWRVYFRKKSYSLEPIFGAKLTGEPPICLAVSVPIAIRQAIVSAREESGILSTKWFSIDGPYSLEKICMSSETRLEDFKF